ADTRVCPHKKGKVLEARMRLQNQEKTTPLPVGEGGQGGIGQSEAKPFAKTRFFEHPRVRMLTSR
ncbi:MAG: hypothetical protein ABIN58_05635, partial [candidate division WOR-3 bacterium]